MPFVSKKITLKDGQVVTLRSPKLSDVKMLQRFINDASKEKTFILAQGKKYSYQEELEYVKRLLKNIKQKQSVALVFETGNRIIGNAQIHKRKEDIHSHIADFHITISHDYRGFGLGKILMTEIHNFASQELKEIKMFCLSVFGNNTVALRLYKQFGYVIYGKLPQGIFHRGEYVAGIDMYKVFNKNTQPEG